MKEPHFKNKPIVITAHAIKRCRERDIGFPDQIYDTIHTGKVSQFGKNYLKFKKESKYESIICIGEDVGHCIVIKTVERGN